VAGEVQRAGKGEAKRGGGGEGGGGSIGGGGAVLAGASVLGKMLRPRLPKEEKNSPRSPGPRLIGTKEIRETIKKIRPRISGPLQGSGFDKAESHDQRNEGEALIRLKTPKVSRAKGEGFWRR